MAQDFVAVVPARGGSVGLPGKNIVPFLGRPLIGHAIATAHETRNVSRVIATTDDDRIAEAARDAGAEIVPLPAELAGPKVHVIDAVLHALNEQNVRDDTLVVLLQPTSPLRTAADIDETHDLYRANDKVKSVVQMSYMPEHEHHPLKNFLLVDGRPVPVGDWRQQETPRKELPQVVRATGGVYTALAGDLRAHRRFFILDVLPQLIPAERAVDIDTEADLRRALEIAHRLGWPDHTTANTVR